MTHPSAAQPWTACFQLPCHFRKIIGLNSADQPDGRTAVVDNIFYHQGHVGASPVKRNERAIRNYCKAGKLPGECADFSANAELSAESCDVYGIGRRFRQGADTADGLRAGRKSIIGSLILANAMSHRLRPRAAMAMGGAFSMTVKSSSTSIWLNRPAAPGLGERGQQLSPRIHGLRVAR